MRAAAVRDRAGQVVAQVINNLPEDVGATLPNLRNMKKTVHRARVALRVDPERREPETITGWAFPEELEFFPDGSLFKLYDSGENDRQRFIIMGSDRALRVLGTQVHFFSDGTFSGVPLFQQLYTLHSDYVRLYATLSISH